MITAINADLEDVSEMTITVTDAKQKNTMIIASKTSTVNEDFTVTLQLQTPA